MLCVSSTILNEYAFLHSCPYKSSASSGRSMGSRAAVALARQLSEAEAEAEAEAVAGVVCLSFPLHPPGQQHAHQQRSEDLRGLPVGMPVLLVSGTADNMCDRVNVN